MKSRVYFIPVENLAQVDSIADKLAFLVKKSEVLDFIRKDDKAILKIHFGEEGNAGFVKPEYVKVINNALVSKGAITTLADTNTLYKGRRTNSTEHLKLAYEHGFTKERSGVEVVIPDDSKKENTIDIEINQKFIKTAKLVRLFSEADAIIGISHFKGHIMTGFGGGLKNLGMGCASREGKLMQHSNVSPVVYEQKCIGCGECERICPVKAIRIENNKSVINGVKCIGCASCIAVCPTHAIDVNWESGGSMLQEKMVEYASAVMKGKKEKIVFFNFAIKITKECDCLAKDDPCICPDVGILASNDPVSIDKASLDLVIKISQNNVFKKHHPNRDGMVQLNYAHKLGLGNLDYELIEI